MTKLEEHLHLIIGTLSGDVDVAEIKAAAIRTMPADLAAVVDTIRAAAGDRALDRLIRAALRHHTKPDIPGLLDAYPIDGKRIWTMRDSMTIPMWIAALERMERADRREAERRALQRGALEQWGRDHFGEAGIVALARKEERA